MCDTIGTGMDGIFIVSSQTLRRRNLIFVTVLLFIIGIVLRNPATQTKEQIGIISAHCIDCDPSYSVECDENHAADRNYVRVLYISRCLYTK